MGAAEIQAARKGVEVDRWKEMASKGDFEGMGEGVGDVAEQAGRGVGGVVSAGAGGVEEGGKMLGGWDGGVVEGVGKVGAGVGEGVGEVAGGVGRGVGKVGGGVGRGLGLGKD